MNSISTNKSINEFRGQYFFLSNFYPCSIEYEGLTYFSVEAAYQAQKTDDRLIKRKYSLLSAAEAKKLSHKVEVRKDWNDVKVPIMRELLQQKFTKYPHLKEQLLATGDIEIIEGNNWGDIFWGVCEGKGENMLGKLLMEIRFYLMNEDIFEY